MSHLRLRAVQVLRAAALDFRRRGNLLLTRISYKMGDCFGTPSLAGGARENRLAMTFVR
jgi:hypothetical protein